MREAIAKLVLAAIIILVPSLCAATPFVGYEVTMGPGSLFTYNLTIYNSGGTEPLAGLIVWNGNSVFNLDDTSLVNTPANWGDIPPIAGLADGLTFFSFDPSTEVPVGGLLGGLSFVSSTDPSTLTGDDFEVVGIGGTDDEQIPLGDAVVTEPTAILLLAPAVIALLRKRR